MPDSISSRGQRNAGSLSSPRLWLAIGALLLATTLLLKLQGRVWWCACRTPIVWSTDVHSSHNSQHLVDPYSLTHVSHGLIFFGLFAWLTPRMAMSRRFWLSLFIEAAWEVIENTSWVIDRYRAATISLEYYGDSVVNSLGDVACCAAGWLFARRFGLRPSIVLLIATELILLLSIRDNLTLNVLMLICPLDAIRTWQAG